MQTISKSIFFFYISFFFGQGEGPYYLLGCFQWGVAKEPSNCWRSKSVELSSRHPAPASLCVFPLPSECKTTWPLHNHDLHAPFRSLWPHVPGLSLPLFVSFLYLFICYLLPASFPYDVEGKILLPKDAEEKTVKDLHVASFGFPFVSDIDTFLRWKCFWHSFFL